MIINQFIISHNLIYDLVEYLNKYRNEDIVVPCIENIMKYLPRSEMYFLII